MRRRGVFEGTALAVFLALVHTVNAAITAILGALLPTIQQQFDASPAVLATIVATYWIASSVTQPLFGSLAEDVGMRLVGSIGVLFAALFLSLVGVAPVLYLVFGLLVIGGMGSAALHPVGTTVARGTTVNNAALGVGFFTAGGMLGFAFGPVLVLYLIEHHGIGSTPWLMAPGLLLALLFYFVLPDWQPHGWRRLLDVFELRLLRGSIGWLALAASFTSVSFVTFTSSIPVWLVNEEGFAPDDPVIGWTLGAFSVSAGL
jgi:FSR family fosmidomycin resistance protein-like MFS transporter